MATFYIDPEGGNDANNGTTFALRKKQTFPTMSAGDELRVIASPDPVSIGNATWTNFSDTVTLAGALTDTIYNDGAWTAGASVTATTVTTRKLGANASSLAIAAGFTTGRAAHFATGSKNLSGYNKISFVINFNTAVTNMNIYEIRLCSDTGGTTTVDTLTLPNSAAAASTWMNITIDKGSALGASIQSVALYTNSDPGVVTVLIDDIIACNDLTLTSIIGKNTTDELFWGIKSIDGVTVKLEGNRGDVANATQKGYIGTTGSTTTYIIEPIKISTTSTAGGEAIFSPLNDGTFAAPIVVSGGWDRTAMTSQTGLSYIAPTKCNGNIFNSPTNRNYVTFQKLFGVRGNISFSTNTNIGLLIEDCGSLCSLTYGIIMQASKGGIFRDLSSIQSTNIGVYALNSTSGCLLENIKTYSNNAPNFEFGACFNNVIKNVDSRRSVQYGFNVLNGATNEFIDCSSISNQNAGLRLLSGGDKFYNFTIQNNSSFAIDLPGNSLGYFYGLTTSGNTTAAFNFSGFGSRAFVKDWSYAEATPYRNQGVNNNGFIFSINDDLAGSHKVYTEYGTVVSSTATRHTASGISWEIKLTNATYINANMPFRQAIQAVPVKSGVAMTASVWMYRSNTGVTGVFGMRGGQVSGTTDITDTITVGATTWEQLTLTFTPTEDGVVEFYVGAYGGTTYSLFWDDFAVSAASYIDASSGDYPWVMSGIYIGENASTGGGLTEFSSTFS